MRPLRLHNGSTCRPRWLTNAFPIGFALWARVLILPCARVQTVDVPLWRTQDLLDAHSYDYVDFMSIDVEGAELGVVSTIDFQRTHIRSVPPASHTPRCQVCCVVTNALRAVVVAAS